MSAVKNLAEKYHRKRMLEGNDLKLSVLSVCPDDMLMPIEHLPIKPEDDPRLGGTLLPALEAIRWSYDKNPSSTAHQALPARGWEIRHVHWLRINAFGVIVAIVAERFIGKKRVGRDC